MGHTWSDEEMEETIDICLAHPPGAARELAGAALVTRINLNPANPIGPEAIGQALKAADHAILGNNRLRPRPSKRLIELVEARRTQGKLIRRWP